MPRRKKASSPYWFDEKAAQHVCDFFEQCLCHSKGEWAGKPFILAPWQKKILRDAFGWKHPDGKRKVRTVYVEIPRKNGKSTFAAGIALYLLTADAEPGADIFSAALDKPQAGIVFGEAKRMVKSSKALSEECEPYKSAILVPSTVSAYQVLSADADNKHGLNAHGVVFDELHVQDDRNLYDVLSTSMGSRRQPMMWMFTTAGSNRTSLCWEMHEYARKVTKGEIEDETFLGVIFGAKETDNWHSPDVWMKANPNYGISINPQFLFQQHQEACSMPGKELAFKQLLLNLWVQGANRWMSMARWDKCAGTLDEKDLAGAKCYVGLDLSRRTDTTSMVAIFKKDQKFLVKRWTWLPEEGIEDRERRDKVPYRQWAEQKLITLTPGDVIDYAFVLSEILNLARTNPIEELAYDPYGSTQLALQLIDNGINCFECPQSMKFLSEPTKTTEALVLQERLIHGGDPVLRWMVENANEHRDTNDNVRLIKSKSAGRIDSAVALIMAIGRATLTQEFVSIYSTRGVPEL